MWETALSHEKFVACFNMGIKKCPPRVLGHESSQKFFAPPIQCASPIRISRVKEVHSPRQAKVEDVLQQYTFTRILWKRRLDNI